TCDVYLNTNLLLHNETTITPEGSITKISEIAERFAAPGQQGTELPLSIKSATPTRTVSHSPTGAASTVMSLTFCQPLSIFTSNSESSALLLTFTSNTNSPAAAQ